MKRNEIQKEVTGKVKKLIQHFKKYEKSFKKNLPSAGPSEYFYINPTLTVLQLF